MSTRKTSRIMRRINLVLLFVWSALTVPTVLVWRDSILWIALMSVYAIVVAHWSAYQASRAEHEAEKTNGD